MSDIAVQREISRIDSPPIGPLLPESHRDRQRIPFGIWACTGAEFSCAGILTRHVWKGWPEDAAHRRRCWKRENEAAESSKIQYFARPERL